MKRLLPVLGAIFLPLLCLAQIKYENISSEKLGESRQIKIQLPRNYEENTDKTYPVLLVLDGDYLFEPVAGMVDYYSYWEDIPEMIVVGVNQDGIRMEDTKYSKQDFLPVDKGAKFFEFLGMELLAHIDQKYRTGNFKIIMGHDFTSNFINYYLLKENPIFRGYINLSPDLAPGMADHIVNSLSKSETRSWYYMATSDEDIPTLKKAILAFNNQLKGIDNKNLHYKFEEFENTSHYTLVGKAIPSAIADIFSIYRPISQKDFNETLLQTSISPTQFLTEKYQSIEDLYGVRKKIRLNDFFWPFTRRLKNAKLGRIQTPL